MSQINVVLNLEKQVNELTDQLKLANQAITKLQTEMNEFKKKAISLDGDKPHKHHFSTKIIQKSIELFKSGLGYKQTENIFKTLFSDLNQKKPSDSTIRLWVMRSGICKIK